MKRDIERERERDRQKEKGRRGRGRRGGRRGRRGKKRARNQRKWRKIFPHVYTYTNMSHVQKGPRYIGRWPDKQKKRKRWREKEEREREIERERERERTRTKKAENEKGGRKNESFHSERLSPRGWCTPACRVIFHVFLCLEVGPSEPCPVCHDGKFPMTYVRMEQLVHER